jgi:hypothetical protein
MSVYVFVCARRPRRCEIFLNMKPFEGLTALSIHMHPFTYFIICLEAIAVCVNNILGFRQVNLHVIVHLHLITQRECISDAN